jgi:phosphoglycerate kinase
LALDAVTRKIVALRGVIEADTDGCREDSQWRVYDTKDFVAGRRYHHFLDVAPYSFDEPAVRRVFAEARTIFVNAVMGRMPEYVEGTGALNTIIAQNRTAQKLYGGGDTLQVNSR